MWIFATVILSAVAILSGQTFGEITGEVRDSTGRHNQKRGRDVEHVSLDEAAAVGSGRAADLVVLDDALNALARLDARKV
jgi:hypothetical protein